MKRIKGSNRSPILLALVSIALSLLSHTSYAFKIYSNFQSYTNIPDLSEFGIGQVKLLTTGALWAPGEDQEQVPTVNKLDGLKTWSKNWVGIDMVVADIEHWPLHDKDEELASEAMRKFEETFAQLKARLPQYPIGFYRMLPRRDYWRAISGLESEKYQEWIAENNKLRPLAAKVDVLFPSLYTFYDNVDDWKTYARENILEAKRLANGKPVVCYVWPRFHNSSSLSGKLIPGSFWREQLELIKEYADGVIIWDHVKTEWAGDAEWWVQTVKFIERHGLDKPMPSPPKRPSDFQAIAE